LPVPLQAEADLVAIDDFLEALRSAPDFSNAVFYSVDACHTGTVGAAEKSAAGLSAMSDDSTCAMRASRRKGVNGALEAVKGV